jgi:hypothetical protein
MSERKAQAVQLYLHKVSMADIWTFTGIHPTDVYRELEEQGLLTHLQFRKQTGK